MGSPADRFIGWPLPQLREVNTDNGSAELALARLHEFLNTGDASGIEQYASPILRTCQELLEDERTPLTLLRTLLGLLTVLSAKFTRCFQSHFADIVDLLLGWALLPDLSETDRCLITDEFLQFQKLWVGNLQLSLNLLSKFLGDMEVLAQDTMPGTPQQLRRLLALVSCFVAVLQATASGVLEVNLLECIIAPLQEMLPRLLTCLSMAGRKFGNAKWMKESSRCLILLADILREWFANFYPAARDILLQSLETKNAAVPGAHALSPNQVQAVLKTNLHLMSAQRLALLPSAVHKILQMDSLFTRLRLHPNHLVTGVVAATYLFVLRHGSNEVVSQAIVTLTEELEILKILLLKAHFAGITNSVTLDVQQEHNNRNNNHNAIYSLGRVLSELEVLALIKFDLMVLTSCACLGTLKALSDSTNVINNRIERAKELSKLMIEKLNPFQKPFLCYVELQLALLKALHRLSNVIVFGKHMYPGRICNKFAGSSEFDGKLQMMTQPQKEVSLAIAEHLNVYGFYIAKALHVSASLSIKLEALDWISSFCEGIITMNSGDDSFHYYFYQGCDDFRASWHMGLNSILLFPVLCAASDRELKVRARIASVLQLLLQAKLIYPVYFEAIANTALERLGDPDPSLQAAFRKVLSLVVLAALYSGGWAENADKDGYKHSISFVKSANRKYWHWKQVFAIKQLSQPLRSQQLVSVLNYISQRCQVVPSNWLQRLVFSYRGNLKSRFPKQRTDAINSEAEGLWMDLNVDFEMLERVCSTNNLAAAWWAIHEAARHCITVCLRTRLGGPTQTFAAIERMLLDVAQLLQVDPGLRDASGGTSSPGVHLLPMRLLLEFVESLKKHIYNAYEGSAVLPAAPSQSALFFRRNKKVCEEWFARICEALMNASLAIQCHAGTFHYAAMRLQDLRNVAASQLRDMPRPQIADNSQSLRSKYSSDVLRVLRHASLALCRLHESDALVGLHIWATSTFSALPVDDSLLGQKSMGVSGQLGWMTGLVYQARGQYEKAAAHFTHLLQSEEALGSMGADEVQFVIARIIESYVALADWDSLDRWLQELQLLRAKHAGKSHAGALTTAGNEMNAIHALARFDGGDIQGAWGYLDLTPQSSSELTVDPRQALNRSEQMLLQAMLRTDSKGDEITQEIERAKAMLEEALLVASLDGLSEASPYATQFHCIYAFEEGRRFRLGKDESGSFASILSSLQQVVQIPMNVLQQDCLLWSKLLRVYRAVLPESNSTLQLCQQLIRLARKQSNFHLAHRLQQDLLNSLSNYSRDDFKEWLVTSLRYESILLLFAEEKHEEAIIELWSLVCSYLPVFPVSSVSGSSNLMKAKSCLKLSSWLKQKYSEIHWPNLLLKMNLDIPNLKSSDFAVNVEDTVSMRENGWMSAGNCALILEEVAGVAIKASTLLCPNMAKAWLSYASWCYNRAKVSLSGHGTAIKLSALYPILSEEISSDGTGLLEEEATRVRAIITRVILKNEKTPGSEEISMWPDFEVQLKSESVNFIEVLVQHIVYMMQAASGAAGVENSDGESASSLLFAQLQRELLNIKPNIESSLIIPAVNELMDIWLTLRRRRVLLFGYAARGFLQYLSLSSMTHHENGHLKNCNLYAVKHEKEDCTLRATLYILHILLNYGVELGETLQQGLMMGPPLSWQEITPQLFARLSTHPEQQVRKQLEGLLMMLAKLSPWAIVYPTLVDINAYDGEPSEELQRILDCLVKVHPKLVQDVQLMIAELGIITVLWEEQWLSTLQDLHADVTRRIATLKEEVSRVAENVTLTHSEKAKINAAKYSAMMAPIAVALERRLASTSRTPETAHEDWFQKEYGEQLKAAITNFKTPPSTAASLADVWRTFDAIAASLANHQKKSSVSLSDVAPQLARLSSSDAPMPGLEKQMLRSDSVGAHGSDLQGIVTVSSFSEQVSILATKTKPKKLIMLGSDGQRYTYLLKGREDLRLDARIMQLLQAVNGMLHASTGTLGHSLAVRYYSVTPISGRAGLIQWVDNLISMYSVFKAWQQRVQYAQFASNGTGTTNTPIPPVPRPSDMFYGKIIPALKEKGLRKVISRRDWPQEVKRKVLLDLMKETPRQLLYREIWCASGGFQAFNLKLRRFSGSVAVMSMVGHILGLGDRHLDNILMDFSTGDVVHIDYNVCFDKGLRLKIPEIVPFRLTQTMQAALGLTGIEGEFRANCEAVIEVLRKNKDIILMLLEVFVWDPLIEWMRGDGHDEATIGGEERKGMELAVSLSLFASRVQEIRVPLQEHHDLLLGTLPAAASSLQSLADALDRYERISTIFVHAEQERSKSVMSESSAKSIVKEAASNLEKFRIAYEVQAREFAQAKALATEAAQKAALWVEQHSRVLDALRTGSAPEIQTIGQVPGTPEALSLTSAVLAAGVPLTIVPEPTQAHCRDVDREVAHLTTECHEALLHASKALQTYSMALQRLLPGNYIATSQVHGWAQVLQLSVRKISPDALALARRQASDLVAKAQGEHADSIHQKYETLQMKVEMLVKEIRKVQGDCAELEASIESENERKAKDRVLAIFTKHLHPSGHLKKDEDGFARISGHNKQEETKERDMGSSEQEERKAKILTVLHVAAATLYSEIKEKISDICNSMIERIMLAPGEDVGHQNWKWCFPDLEEQVERCALVAGIVNEVQQMSGQSFLQRGPGWWDTTGSVDEDWASSFQSCLTAIRSLVGQMVGFALPEAIKSVLSHNPAIMEAFGSLSQIRGAVDTSLEQLAEIEMQRASLAELERSYYENVGEITERKSALETAAAKGRDHLSWEEAEELASQEEACRAQLDQLHKAWSQRGAQASALVRKEGSVRGALVAAEQRFQSLVAIEQDGDMHLMRGKVLLATFARPFSELESFDQRLPSFGSDASYWKKSSVNQIEIVSSGFSGFESVWKATNMLKDHTFFVWKIGIIDASLDLCIRDVSSTVDHTLSFDQIISSQKRKLEIQFESYLDQYLRERFAPVLLECLDKERESLKHISVENRELDFQLAKRELDAVKRAQGLLLEYCNVHETARAAKAAASSMKMQVGELTQDLQKANLEVSQLEWLHDFVLPPQQQNSILTQSSLNEEMLPCSFVKLNRRNLLENIRSAMSTITRATEGLQGCERTAISTEEQLERAMGWACAGPNTGSGASNSGRGMGIPPEFHDHLRRRRQLLWAGQDQAAGVLKLCAAVLEFEASRDGFLRSQPDVSTGGALSDGRAWQQAYMNMISRLDVSYHSFTCADREWQLAQKSMEAASSGLSSATNDLRLVSLRAKSASGELQSTLSSMRDGTVEASAALSAFCRVARGNYALTTETGSMLEEVLAITEGAEGAHDVYSLAKEAASKHSNLMSELNKVNMLLLPLEPMLASASSALVGLITREGEQKLEISPGQGQALFQSLHLKLGEVRPVLTSTVPVLLNTVKELHMSLTRLARTASFDAGVLHKALEGVGESQEARSQELDLARPELAGDEVLSEEQDKNIFEAVTYNGEDGGELVTDEELVLQGDEDCWISPPDSLYTSGSDSEVTSVEDTISQHHEVLSSVSNDWEARGSGADKTKLAEEMMPDISRLMVNEDTAFTSSSFLAHSQEDPSLVRHIGTDTSFEVAEDSGKEVICTGNSQIHATKATSQRPEGSQASVSSNKASSDSQSTTHVNLLDMGLGSSNAIERHQMGEIHPGMKPRQSQLNRARGRVGSYGDLCTVNSSITTEQGGRAFRGKNAYAVSVLKRVEAKLDGWDVDCKRQFTISEQVDHLLRQATSIDNLCNMYEGWTPWI
eukprot:Gb_14475 [translate_table: standard]